MIEGSLLWDEKIIRDMTKKSISECKAIWTFSGLAENLFDALKKTAGRFPQKTALADEEGRNYTYQEFLNKCEELAAYLHWQKNIKAGSHVGIMMHNTIEYCIAFFALSRIGAVTISLPSKFKPKEVCALAQRADMEYLICEQEYSTWFDSIEISKKIVLPKEQIAESGYESVFTTWNMKEQNIEKMKKVPGGHWTDPVILMFTSGTTSQSKGVLLKNYHVMHAVEAYRRTLQITDKDISVIATPIYHITGLIALLGLFLTTGGTLYLHKIFDAEKVIRDARKYKFTFLHASPTVFHMILQKGENSPEISSLRSLACGSSNMSKEKLLRFHKWLPNSKFHTIYGLTETSSPGTVFPDDASTSEYIGSSGRPIPGMYFKIVDENHREVPDGDVGEIAVKGANVLDNYYGQEPLEDGWLYTGDLGYFNKQKYLFVVDRKKDMINRGGEKIWCFDVENELESMREIQNAAVVGIPDELYGEVAAAMVEKKENASITPDEIQKYLRTKMAKYKVPVKIKIVDQIPHTVNGKPDKKVIKKILMEDE